MKNIKHDNQNIKLQIWDTAGQERFRTLTASYYRGAQGIIIVYDVTDRDSFENVRTWIEEIEKYSKPGVCKILVGNKCDATVDERQVSTEEAREFAKEYHMPFLETSAKKSLGVDEAFTLMTKEIKDKQMAQKPQGQANKYSVITPLGQGKAIALPTEQDASTSDGSTVGGTQLK